MSLPEPPSNSTPPRHQEPNASRAPDNPPTTDERSPAPRAAPWSTAHDEHRWPDDDDWTGGDDGQATAEYALVLLGAALVALLLIGWATGGGGGGKIGHLLDHVLDTITSKL